MNENTTRVAIEFMGLKRLVLCRLNTSCTTTPRKTATRLGVFCEDPGAELLIPVMTAVDSVLLREHVTDPNVTTADTTSRVKVSFKDFPHDDFQIVVDVMQRYGVGFIFGCFIQLHRAAAQHGY